jgi:hypothetical protein
LVLILLIIEIEIVLRLILLNLSSAHQLGSVRVRLVRKRRRGVDRRQPAVLVAKGTLNELCYLEHSAFWAIGSLASIMYLNVVMHIPEVVTGCIGAALIAAGIYHSIKVKQKEEAEEAVTNAA